MEVLSSGKTSFKIEVPYKLFHTGEETEKPLIVYLHGAGQNISQFEKLAKPFFELSAYHLFIQGPYADTANIKHRGEWGFGWYLYSGKQGSFVKSLEYTSEFIQSVIDSVTGRLNVSRLCVVGYSMGAYQAGYFGLSRWKHTSDLIMIGGRVKSESFSVSRLQKCHHMNIVAIHGKKDEHVPFNKQQEAMDMLSNAGLSCRMVPIEGGHKLTSKAVGEAVKVLREIGY